VDAPETEGIKLRNSYLPYSPDLSPTDYHFLKHLDNLLQEKILNNEAEAESPFNESVGSRTSDFYQSKIMKHASRWQKCVDYNGFYFD
jgi:histone-lysine N-methyltransferase SETMAR